MLAKTETANVHFQTEPPALLFLALEQLGIVAHTFAVREPNSVPFSGIVDQRAIRDYHERVLQPLGFSRRDLAVAEQVHGNCVSVVREHPALPIAGVDGLITNQRGLPLGIYVADCCAVFIVDRATPAIALLHSGKIGTQKNIVGEAMREMRENFQTSPANCIAVLSPCIGVCHYEMDIGAAIESQLAGEGVKEIFNPRLCTACHVEKFYSYRTEKGKTGRMLGVLALR